MKFVSLSTAIALTGWSERTFWRRFSDGSVTRIIDDGKSMVSFESIKTAVCIPLSEDASALIERADKGHAESQNDLALLFIEAGQSKGAVHWLENAAKQGYPDAMHWLARCYFEGSGIKRDENLGMMWLAKAAAQGHVISQGQMQAFLDRFVQNDQLKSPSHGN